MAKLFNKIRKQLVVNKPSASRTANYLKYAIGEIVLVVIGILIALQINNWNQQKTQQKDGIYILRQFLVALNSDKIQLEEIILSTTLRQKKVDSIIKILENPSKNQTLQFIQLQSALVTDDYFKATQGTFQEAISSGKLKLIQNNKLREQIYNYYDVISDPRSNDYSNYKLTNEFIVPILVEEIGSTNQVSKMYLDSDNQLPELDLMKISKNRRYYQAILYSKEDVFQLIDWNDYKNLVLNLISEIENELSK